MIDDNCSVQQVKPGWRKPIWWAWDRLRLKIEQSLGLEPLVQPEAWPEYSTMQKEMAGLMVLAKYRENEIVDIRSLLNVEVRPTESETRRMEALDFLWRNDHDLSFLSYMVRHRRSGDTGFRRLTHDYLLFRRFRNLAPLMLEPSLASSFAQAGQRFIQSVLEVYEDNLEASQILPGDHKSIDEAYVTYKQTIDAVRARFDHQYPVVKRLPFRWFRLALRKMELSIQNM